MSSTSRARQPAPTRKAPRRPALEAERKGLKPAPKRRPPPRPDVFLTKPTRFRLAAPRRKPPPVPVATEDEIVDDPENKAATAKPPRKATKSNVDLFQYFEEQQATWTKREQVLLKSRPKAPTRQAPKAPILLSPEQDAAVPSGRTVSLLTPAPPVLLSTTIAQVPDKQSILSAGNVEDKYTIQRNLVLGTGLTAVVCLGVNKETNEEVAVKIMSKKHAAVDEDLFLSEVNVLHGLEHTHIVRLIDVYEDLDYFYIVSELAFGGELFDRILEKKVFRESDARDLLQSLLSAVAYLHEHGIVHRDLKPENVLYSTFEADAVPKITDFGFASKGSSDAMSQQLGTQGYAAPEIFAGSSYSAKCDIYSLGVIGYILLCGVPPFVELEDYEKASHAPFWIYQNRMEKIPTSTQVSFDSPKWEHVSSAAQSFLTAALQLDPHKRPTSTELLKHQWFASSENENSEFNMLTDDTRKGMIKSTDAENATFVRTKTEHD